MAVTHWYDALLPYVGNDTWDPGYQYLESKAGGAKNALEGDPASVSTSLQNLSNQAYSQGQQVKDFLLGRENNAEQYYRPMQQMFGSMYGTGGVMPGQAPGVPGSSPVKGGGA